MKVYNISQFFVAFNLVALLYSFNIAVVNSLTHDGLVHYCG